ncbi:hypothetical protein CLIB1423_26S00826 [[Candida] railenensis]|uniref:Uncharacterized protein n=1 Tax=[Candida] railenensis TaxID=45579 RepID=A0A9P0W191_9ASCO|nr:hypothetical protein CLIB1423_26S00826 [[Candida] railenensis]
MIRVTTSIVQAILVDLQIIQNNPFSIITSPDTYNPPFTNSLDVWYNVTDGIPHHHEESWGFIGLAILFAGFDVLYSMFRLFAAGLIGGTMICVCMTAFLWIVVTLKYRWQMLKRFGEIDWTIVC